jgi:hypothetical protein
MAAEHDLASRLHALCDRLEVMLAERDAAIATLRRERDAAVAAREELRARLTAAEDAREADHALRDEAADALDRAIDELRTMATPRAEESEERG